MDKIRKQIRGVDAKIIALIAKRMNLSKKLGAIKKEKKLPIRIKEREKLLFQEWRGIAITHGISPMLVKKLWSLI